MTLDDVSDLDDVEPSTTDGIFGFYEKVISLPFNFPSRDIYCSKAS